MESVETIKRIIATAYGSDAPYIKHSLNRNLVFTDTINQIRQAADAFWLVDAIASYRRKEVFQVWELKVDLEKKKAVLTMKEDSDTPELVRQEISHTDFPLDYIKFYVEEGGYGSMDNWTPCLVLEVPTER